MHLFKSFFKREGSSRVAKTRLQNMLFKDRMDLPANFLEMVACDVKQAVSAYMDLEDTWAEIGVGRKCYDGSVLPVIEITLPVRNVQTKSRYMNHSA